tara:strand:- start:1295 stop:1852 length:558 start_codon:yes stop_codon:yes gene_type:complete
MVKNIQFAKAEQKYLKEARYEQEGFSGLSQLREPYDVTITMFGNVGLFPGTYIYVDPRGMGKELGNPSNAGTNSWMLGLGGYYMVIKAESTITDSGTFETVVTAKWVANGSKKCEDGAPSSASKAKCTVIVPPDVATSAAATESFAKTLADYDVPMSEMRGVGTRGTVNPEASIWSLIMSAAESY